MAVYRIFPEKDSFIFSESPTANAGLDEIIEIGGYQDTSGVGEASRILIQFSQTELQNIFNNYIQTSSFSASLGVYLADAYQIPYNTSIYAYPIYSETGWDNGTGKYGDIPVNSSGVSWNYRQTGASSPWLLTSFPLGVTGSYADGKSGGGNWYYEVNGNPVVSVQANSIKSTYDIQLNVTDAVTLWNTEEIDNNGLLLKVDDAIEFNTTSSVRLKYFSSDTNTIFPPYLDLKWDDSIYSTGSLTLLENSNAIISINNNVGKYADTGKQRFRLSAKPKYPVRTFTTSSIYLQNYALPQETYWGLRDENSEEMIIDFDTDFTKVSCDSQGSYFDIFMDGLQPERYYRILVKTALDGSTTIVDNGNVFKVVRNG